MSSALARKPRSRLPAEPRFFVTPPTRVSLGSDAVEFAAKAGLVMDSWQADVLEAAMGLKPGGLWASRSVGLLVPRQNGKGSILEARELYGMFAGDERLIIHSAHRYDTSQLHFQRLLDLIEGNPDLDRHMQRVSKIAGKETITVRRQDGSRCELKFKARTLSGSGRGFSCDLLVLDESFLLPEEALAAMLPTLAARANPQIWYTSSAGYPTSRALWRVVNRGRAGELGTYIEYGCGLDADPADQGNWERANPGLDVRLSRDLLEDNYALMLPEDFAREHLGMWDETAGGVISVQKWAQARDPSSEIVGDVAFAVDTTPDRAMTAVAVAGLRADGLLQVEVTDYAPDTDWVAGRLQELQARWWPLATVVDPSASAGSLIPELKAAGVDVVDSFTARDYAHACGQFYDAVTASQTLRHLGQPMLDAAVVAATQRPLADAWAWSRKTGDICPLVAATLAAWGFTGNQGLNPADVHVIY